MMDQAEPVELLHDFLTASAQREPDKIALVCGDARVSYAALELESNRLAHVLVARGVSRGDRVIILGENVLSTVVAFWGVLKANAVVVMVNPQTKVEKLAYLVADCEPAAVIADAHLVPVVTAAGGADRLVVSGADHGAAPAVPAAPPARTAIDVDLAAIIYTSGSTGEPKGAMHSHRSMRSAARSVMTYLGNTGDDVILDVMPLAFNYGLYQMITAFAIGARLVLERSFAYPARVLEIMARERVTALPGVPTMFATLTGMSTLGDYDLSALRYITNAAAALPVKHVEALLALFPEARIYSMYGLTECKRVSYLPPEQLRTRPTSVGVAIPNTEIWVVDEHDQRLPPGEVGQLVVRGATVMRGYWGKPEETLRKLRPGPSGEHVLYTGDYARFDDDGYLYIVGRMDDMIKSRGEKVAPREIEDALVAAPGVLEAAVIGVRDDLLGQAVAAFVVPREGAALTPRALQLHCHGLLESYMVPRHIVFATSLPRTPNGKIDKTKLILPE